MSAEAASPPSRLLSFADRLKSVTGKPVARLVPLTSIDSNPNQPRQHFDEESLITLAETIRNHGIVQPLVVRPQPGERYQLVAGERRWRAAKIAGLAEVPVVIRELSDAAALAIALIENLDREPMLPLDEVSAVARLVEETSAQDAAKQLGKDAAWISKRRRIAGARDFVSSFVKLGLTSDIEALYELAKLADEDEDAARRIVENFTPGERLRERIKTAARAGKEGDAGAAGLTFGRGEGEQGDLGDEPEVSHAKAGGGLAAADADTGGEDDEEDRQPRGTPKKSAGDRMLIVTGAVKGKGKGRIVLLTKSGDEIPCSFHGQGAAQLIKLLKAR